MHAGHAAMDVAAPPAYDRGRVVGALLAVQLAGLIVPFVLVLPLVTAPGAYLASAAARSGRIVTGALLLLVTGAVTVAISIAGWPVFRRSGEGLALTLLVLGGLVLAAQAVDDVHLLSMLSLSQAHVAAAGTAGGAASGTPGEAVRQVAIALGLTRRWAHLTTLLVLDAWILVLYLNLIRARALPRALAAFGLLTVAAHFVAIPLPGFLGLGAVAAAGMPMALSHLLTAGWLMAHGPWGRVPS